MEWPMERPQQDKKRGEPGQPEGEKDRLEKVRNVATSIYEDLVALARIDSRSKGVFSGIQSIDKPLKTFLEKADGEALIELCDEICAGFEKLAKMLGESSPGWDPGAFDEILDRVESITGKMKRILSWAGLPESYLSAIDDAKEEVIIAIANGKRRVLPPSGLL